MKSNQNHSQNTKETFTEDLRKIIKERFTFGQKSTPPNDTKRPKSGKGL